MAFEISSHCSRHNFTSLPFPKQSLLHKHGETHGHSYSIYPEEEKCNQSRAFPNTAWSHGGGAAAEVSSSLPFHAHEHIKVPYTCCHTFLLTPFLHPTDISFPHKLDHRPDPLLRHVHPHQPVPIPLFPSFSLLFHIKLSTGADTSSFSSNMSYEGAC